MPVIPKTDIRIKNMTYLIETLKRGYSPIVETRISTPFFLAIMLTTALITHIIWLFTANRSHRNRKRKQNEQWRLVINRKAGASAEITYDTHTRI